MVWGEFNPKQIENNIAEGRVFLAKRDGVALGVVSPRSGVLGAVPAVCSSSAKSPWRLEPARFDRHR
jgi:hypothetical protein